MTNFGADTPFILLAKITVKEDKVSEYLELADKTDKACLLYTSDAADE